MSDLLSWAICSSDKLGAALMKLDHFILHVGQVAFSGMPSLNFAFVQEHKAAGGDTEWEEMTW